MLSVQQSQQQQNSPLGRSSGGTRGLRSKNSFSDAKKPAQTQEGLNGSLRHGRGERLDTSPTRVRVSTDVDLADLLEKDAEQRGYSDPLELSLSCLRRGSHSSEVSVETMLMIQKLDNDTDTKRTSCESTFMGSFASSLDARPSVHSFRCNGSMVFTYDAGAEEPQARSTMSLEQLQRQPSRKSFEEMVDTASKLEKENETYDLEIFPGHFVPFHNATEVWNALGKGKDHTMKCSCLECEATLVSVAHCEYVVCPDCQMVNPVMEWPAGITPSGAGMGVKPDWITQKLMEDGMVKVAITAA